MDENQYKAPGVPHSGSRIHADPPRPQRTIEDKLLVATLFAGTFLLMIGCLISATSYSLTSGLGSPAYWDSVGWDSFGTQPAEIEDPTPIAFYFAPGLFLVGISSVVIAMRWWNGRRREP